MSEYYLVGIELQAIPFLLNLIRPSHQLGKYFKIALTFSNQDVIRTESNNVCLWKEMKWQTMLIHVALCWYTVALKITTIALVD